MPLRQLDPEAWKASVRRTLIVGGPNTRKTTSLATWPKPLHALVAPGEAGASSLPPTADTHVYTWEQDLAKPESAGTVLAAVRKLTVEILSGTHGPVQTFALDGLHKLYDLVLDDVTEGASTSGDDFEPKLYSRAHARMLDYLKLVKTSAVPYVVFTVWDGTEVLAEYLGGKADSKAPRGIYPELPGKMAKRVMGEFPIVLYAELDQPPMAVMVGRTEVNAWWRLLPTRDTRAAGVKLPPSVAMSLPARVPQDWSKLEPMILGGSPVNP